MGGRVFEFRFYLFVVRYRLLEGSGKEVGGWVFLCCHRCWVGGARLGYSGSKRLLAWGGGVYSGSPFACPVPTERPVVQPRLDGFTSGVSFAFEDFFGQALPRHLGGRNSVRVPGLGDRRCRWKGGSCRGFFFIILPRYIQVFVDRQTGGTGALSDDVGGWFGRMVHRFVLS